MSVLPGEGSHVILYGPTTFSARTRVHEGYLARPDLAGTFPVGAILGEITSGAKELCRGLARHGFVAVAMEPGRRSGDVADLMRWIAAPGTPWADAERVGIIITGTVDAGALDEAAAFVLLDRPLAVDTRGRPVLGLYGAEGAAATEARANHAQVPASRWAFYADAGDGFWSLASDDYHTEAASDAFDRIVAFFSETLGEAA